MTTWTPLRRVLTPVGLTLLALLPAGTAGAATPATGTAATTGTATTATAVPRCHTAQLRASYAGHEAGAGQRYLTVLLTNRGATCAVLGFGGLGLADATGRQLPATAGRSGPAPGRVVLRTGDSAAEVVHYAEGQGAPGDVRAADLTVIPPDETGRLLLHLDDVVLRGALDGTAYAVPQGRAVRTAVAGARVRSAPSTTAAVRTTLGAAGTPTTVLCSGTGAVVHGDPVWLLVSRPTTGWVSRQVLAPVPGLTPRTC